MATGPEMLISTLVKALKLEPQVDKVREMLTPETIARFQAALKIVEGIDGRLARIEQSLGIAGNVSDGNGIEPGSRNGVLIAANGLDGLHSPQPDNGADH